MRVNSGRKFFSHSLILGICYQTPDRRILGRKLALFNLPLSTDGAWSNPRASVYPVLAKGWVTAGLSLSLSCVWPAPGQRGWDRQQEQPPPLDSHIVTAWNSSSSDSQGGHWQCVQQGCQFQLLGDAGPPRAAWGGCGEAPECPRTSTVSAGCFREIEMPWRLLQEILGGILVSGGCSVQEGTTLCRENFYSHPFGNVWGGKRGFCFSCRMTLVDCFPCTYQLFLISFLKKGHVDTALG